MCAGARVQSCVVYTGACRHRRPTGRGGWRNTRRRRLSTVDAFLTQPRNPCCANRTRHPPHPHPWPGRLAGCMHARTSQTRFASLTNLGLSRFFFFFCLSVLKVDAKILPLAQTPNFNHKPIHSNCSQQ